jgi:multidrug efflux pump
VFSRFFIDRPIFASVPSILIFIAGYLALKALPVAQYPDITPPTVTVTALYPGANAQLVLDTVAAPIEQQISGVENLLYMSSQCTNDGQYNLTLTFQLGTDPNMAQVLVQNRVQLALPIIPQEVQKEGVAVLKKSPNIMMIVNLISPDRRYDSIYLSNYATIQIRDELLRLTGVGDVTFLGQRDYSMRAWLDPEKLANLQLTAGDVSNALAQQNVQVAAGQVGQQPVPQGQAFQLTMNALGRLTTPEEFGDIIVKTGQLGQPVQTKSPSSQASSVVRLRDLVADPRRGPDGEIIRGVELGAMSYNQSCTLDGQPSVALSIYQLPGSNALQTARAVYEKMEELSRRFPQGLEYRIVYDTTPFITESIEEVKKTLRDAVILVAVVVLLFLQNWRATIIPLIAVPVAIVGTFAAMAAIGFSLNNLSLFGLILAIGIVVDDAIVVVENVERWLALGEAPREAAIKAMEEVTGPVVAVALVLSAVFVPCAFISGITGQFFRQFALTIAVSTVLSAINSLTLSPALAALLLKPHHGSGHQEALPRLGIALAAAGACAWFLGRALLQLLDLPMVPHISPHEPLEPQMIAAVPTATLYLGCAVVGAIVGWFIAPAVNWALGSFFRLFNKGFDLTTGGYTHTVGILLRGSLIGLIVYGGLLVLTYWQFTEVPTGFIPAQDKGYLVVDARLPDAASVQRTEAVMARIEQIALKKIPGVKHTVSISGQSLIMAANASNFGSMYVMLDEFKDRHSPELRGPAIAQKLRDETSRDIEEADVAVFGPPPVDGLGTTGGFKIIIENRTNQPLPELQKVSDAVVKDGNSTAGLEGMFSSLRADTPWVYLDIDRTKVMSQGVELSDVFDALQIYVGSYYVNNFNQFGRSWQVNIQADARYRKQLSDLLLFKVKNKNNQMVPLSTLLTFKPVGGPVMLTRYNMYSASAISGNTSPGVSTGEAITLVDGVMKKNLPASMVPQWTELTYMQILAGNTAMYVFALAVVLVFLVLAAQYESWSLPLAVILVVPMCLLCSITGVAIASLDVNIFTQIGFVVLVGLASKNAILIVEFAKQQRESGVERRQATLEACRLRLRPIMMTSFAFILGVVPLVIAEGAGAEMRHTLGTAVFSGMLGVTMFGIFLTPIFCYVIQWFSDRRAAVASREPAPASRGA